MAEPLAVLMKLSGNWVWRTLLGAIAEQSIERRSVRLGHSLGIGGAERLVVDAASVLQARGHSVLIVTSHHDRTRCFEETRDGTLAVAVAGAVVPRHVRGRLHVLCATVRGLAGAVWLLAREPGLTSLPRKARLLERRARRFAVRADSECTACRKRIGIAAFAHLPSGDLAHIGCHH